MIRRIADHIALRFAEEATIGLMGDFGRFDTLSIGVFGKGYRAAIYRREGDMTVAYDSTRDGAIRKLFNELRRAT